jgi:DNA-binding GntR family transcriptional regulator
MTTKTPVLERRSASVADPLPLAVLSRATFRTQVADQLRQAIIRGDVKPGSAVTEANLAQRFGVSRGPLREAMSQLQAEGLLVIVPYTGTHIIELSLDDVREIYSIRTALETLAFKEMWPRRDARFCDELERRHQALLRASSQSDSFKSTSAEVNLHSLVYERCGHQLLLETWRRIAGRLQLYLAVHQRAHGRRAPLHAAHERYVKLAQGHRLDLMIAEIEHHMRRGIDQLEHYVASSADLTVARPAASRPKAGRRKART